MEHSNSPNPRILILESERGTCAALRRYVVKGWRGASVQSVGASLASIVGDRERLSSFDAILAGCDFSTDGSADNVTLRALRAISADPDNPPVILLTDGGSEYTAVQAMKAGAYDCVPKNLLGKEQVLTVVGRALTERNPTAAGDVLGTLRLFGYAMRRCLANHRGVSVHVAFSAERGEEVVLKVLHRGRGSLSRDTSFERFIDEYKLLYDIDDPAVARIYDFRVTSLYAYIAMEYFADGHLGRKITGAVPPDDALAIATEIAHALAIIHAAGIVHRDLKPGNIMLRRDGSIALIDFGISRSSLSPVVEDSDAISGTPYYMSPEQVRGEPTDERTDVYALGIILYQMLAGEKPYLGDRAEDILAQHTDAPLPALPVALVRYQPLIDRLLAKNPGQRLSSARELIELLDRMRGEEALDYELSATSA